MDGSTDPATSSDSDLAGGASDDVLFGQLGNDWIQGDGSVIDDLGQVTVDVQTRDTVYDPRGSVEDCAGRAPTATTTSRATAATTSIYGDLGQDDLVGGSSTMFGLDRRAASAPTAATRSTAAPARASA